MDSVWWSTFHTALTSGDQESIESVLRAVERHGRKDGMLEAAKIAAMYSVEESDFDTAAREIAREIIRVSEETL